MEGNGNDNNSGKRISEPVLTLQAALNKAKTLIANGETNATILILPGEYIFTGGGMKI